MYSNGNEDSDLTSIHSSSSSGSSLTSTSSSRHSMVTRGSKSQPTSSTSTPTAKSKPKGTGKQRRKQDRSHRTAISKSTPTGQSHLLQAVKRQTQTCKVSGCSVTFPKSQNQNKDLQKILTHGQNEHGLSNDEVYEMYEQNDKVAKTSNEPNNNAIETLNEPNNDVGMTSILFDVVWSIMILHLSFL